MEVRVLAVNRFHPVFEMAKYQGFVAVEEALVSLVNTYGNKALMLHVQDRDFHSVIEKHAQVRQYCVWTGKVTNRLRLPHLTGVQSQDALLSQSNLQLHRGVPNHAGGSSAHQDESPQTKATAPPGGEHERSQIIAKICSSACFTLDYRNLRFYMQVTAVDEESGDATFTTVVVDVLSEGQAGENVLVNSQLLTY